MAKYQRIQFCDFDLWHVILKFNRVFAKFHQVTCSGSCVIVPTKKKINSAMTLKTILSMLPDVNYNN